MYSFRPSTRSISHGNSWSPMTSTYKFTIMLMLMSRRLLAKMMVNITWGTHAQLVCINFVMNYHLFLICSGQWMVMIPPSAYYAGPLLPPITLPPQVLAAKGQIQDLYLGIFIFLVRTWTIGQRVWWRKHVSSFQQMQVFSCTNFLSDKSYIASWLQPLCWAMEQHARRDHQLHVGDIWWDWNLCSILSLWICIGHLWHGV